MPLPISLFHFALWLSSSPVYNVPHSLHISVNGHFGGFYVLAIVNSAALNIKVHMSFWMMIFFWT